MDDPNVNMSTSLIIIKSSEDISGLDVQVDLLIKPITLEMRFVETFYPYNILSPILAQ